MPRRAGRASFSDIPPGLSGWPQSSPPPTHAVLEAPKLPVCAGHISRVPAATGPLQSLVPCLGNLLYAGK